MASRTHFTAWPVPRRSVCSTNSMSVSSASAARTSSAPWPTTTMMRSAPASRAAWTGHQMRGLLSSLWTTLGWDDFMRVPSPAARMIALMGIDRLPVIANTTIRPGAIVARIGGITMIPHRRWGPADKDGPQHMAHAADARLFGVRGTNTAVLNRFSKYPRLLHLRKRGFYTRKVVFKLRCSFLETRMACPIAPNGLLHATIVSARWGIVQWLGHRFLVPSMWVRILLPQPRASASGAASAARAFFHAGIRHDPHTWSYRGFCA